MSRGDLVAYPFADDLPLRRQSSTVIRGKVKFGVLEICEAPRSGAGHERTGEGVAA